jgi:hypothetical protein
LPQLKDRCPAGTINAQNTKCLCCLREDAGRGCWSRRATGRAGRTDRTRARAGQQRVWGVAFGDTHASKQVGGTPPHTRVLPQGGKWPTTPRPRRHSQDRQGTAPHKVPRCAHKHMRGLLSDKTNQPTTDPPSTARLGATPSTTTCQNNNSC